MASASQLPEPRHGTEGGAWGRDKLFLPWSPLRRGDRTGLEPQLSTADNIHMSVRVCLCVCVCVCVWLNGWVCVENERLDLADVSVCVDGVGACRDAHTCMFAQIVKYHS